MTSPEDDVPSLPIGTQLGDKYRLLQVLGQGAAGTVYEAESPTGERVAVKTVWSLHDGGAGSQRLSRFLRESRVASALVSPHIVPVIDGGVDEQHRVAYSVMPLLMGEDAGALVKRLGPLHPVAAVRIIIQAARGLVVAHGAGVVHRDIKPSNLFLDSNGQSILVKICDFGVAKTASSTLNITAPGTTLGSPMYMAPEQLLNAKTVDARADVWALAMTLFELLAGAPAFKEISTFSELILSMSTRPLPLVQQAAPWVDPGLATVLHGALIRDVDARCPSVEAFAEALGSYAAGNPVLSPSLLRAVPSELRATRARAIPVPASWGGAVSALSETAAVSTGASGGRSTPQINAANPQELVGQTLGGKYRLERMLGKGGMGAVFECVDVSSPAGKRHAIKVVLGAERDADALRRFVREARSAREIKSEHVVWMLEAETDAELNIPYIVMELLDGNDLDQLVKQYGPLEPASVCRLFIQACEGLAAAHKNNVIHRDIKPANLFIHQLPSGRLTTKVCDFGVAKQTGLDTSQTSELTQTGGMVGSPMYMSPEQAKSAKHVDHRTDIWSLSLSLHQALSGQKPWAQSGSLGELILAICTLDMSPLQDSAPWIPPALADVVHRGIQRDPADRYQNIDELRAALEPFAAPADKVTREALTSLSESTRNVVAPRATGLGASRASPRPADAPAPPVRRSSNNLLLPIGVFAGVAGVGITAVVALKASSAGPAPATTIVQREVVTVVSVTPPPPSASAAPLVSGRLQIKGSPSRISVNGTPRELSPSGELLLEGAPGDSFFVEFEVGKLRRGPEKITLSRDGSLSPAEIVVTGGPVAPALPGSASPGKPALPAGAAGAPNAGAAGAPAKPVPTPTGIVKPREEF